MRIKETHLAAANEKTWKIVALLALLVRKKAAVLQLSLAHMRNGTLWNATVAAAAYMPTCGELIKSMTFYVRIDIRQY